MSATTATTSPNRGPLVRFAGDRRGIDRTLFLLCAAMATFSFANAAWQSLHALIWIILIVVMIRRREWIVSAPKRWAIPWIVLIGWTLLAAALSPSPGAAIVESKYLLNYLPIFLFALVLRTPREYVRVLAATSVILAIQSVIALRAFALTTDHISERAKGTLSHHMTFSGMVLIIVCMAVALLTFRRKAMDLYWWAFVALATTALLATLTRSAWLALGTGLLIILTFKNPKWLAAVPVAVMTLLLLVPALRERTVSMWDTRGDYSNVQRLSMYPTGLRMVRAHPFLGVGSEDAVEESYPEFERTRPIPPPVTPGGPPAEPYETPDHLHNNVLQIAAMSGIPALLAWLVAFGVFYAQAWRILPARRDIHDEEGRLRRNLILGSLAAVTAFLVMGMFEWNFGDAEVSVLASFALSVPFALDGPGRRPIRVDDNAGTA